MAECSRDASLEYLLELVPGAARHRLHVPGLGLCSLARRVSRRRCDLPGFRLQRLALLDQRIEHFHAFLLRFGEGPETRQPDLMRGLQDCFGHRPLILALAGFETGPSLLQHGLALLKTDCASAGL